MCRTRRVAAVLLCAFVLFALLPVCAAGHRCAGEECPICAAVAVCRGVLRLFPALAICLFAPMAGKTLPCFAVCGAENAFPTTPVSEKVKLSD